LHERQILTAPAREIVAATRPRDLIELGAGSASKPVILLGAMSAAGLARRYVLSTSPRRRCSIAPKSSQPRHVSYLCTCTAWLATSSDGVPLRTAPGGRSSAGH